MAFRVDRNAMFAMNDREPGPAGIVAAELGHDLIAEVDVADGFVLAVRDVAFVPPASRADLLDAIVQSPEALDAIRRVVMATVYGDEEPHDDPRWWLLDRILARIDLERAVPALQVDPSDDELSGAAAFLRETKLKVPFAKVFRTQAVVDAVRSKLPHLVDLPTTAERIEAEAVGLVGLGKRDGHPSVDRVGISVPKVLLLSAAPDLASAMTGRTPSVEPAGELDVVLTIPVDRSLRVGERLACYLVEPEHEHPVAQVSMLSVVTEESGETMLRARFRLLPNTDLSAFEFIVLPVSQPPDGVIGASTARSLLEGEIRLRTAIRLAQKSLTQEALACLADSELAYRQARPGVPKHFKERLVDIRRRIEDEEYSSDLLGDL